MSKCFRKRLEEDITYIDKTANHKKHNYVIPCILQLTFTNKLEINYLRKEYYNVLKCNECNSFHSVSEEHNISGHIFEDIDLTNKNVIYADYEGKWGIPPFKDLINIEYKEQRR